MQYKSLFFIFQQQPLMTAVNNRQVQIKAVVVENLYLACCVFWLSLPYLKPFLWSNQRHAQLSIQPQKQRHKKARDQMIIKGHIKLQPEQVCFPQVWDLLTNNIHFYDHSPL